MMQSKHDLAIVCPSCHNSIGRLSDVAASCASCGFDVANIAGVPLLWAEDREAPFDARDEASTLPVMNAAHLPIPFIQEALASGGLVLELGAGVDVCEAPNLVKTDAFVYSADLDLIADAHRLPFEDDTFDYVYSLAVFEHLHSPWIAAEEIRRVLKPGGQVYTLCAFMQHVHGYPFHYFNMTAMGLERVFEGFSHVETRPSPFCPFDQISVILLDLKAMLEEAPQRSLSRQTAELASLIDRFTHLVPEVTPSLMADTRAQPAWSRIAPGFDCFATK